MKCPYCDDSIHPNAKFCPKCGLPVKEDATLMGSYTDLDGEPGPNRWIIAGGAAGIVTVALLIGWMTGQSGQGSQTGPSVRRETIGTVTAPAATPVAPTPGQYPGSTAPIWSPTQAPAWTPTQPSAELQVPTGMGQPARPRPAARKPVAQAPALPPSNMGTLGGMMRRSNQAAVVARNSTRVPTPELALPPTPSMWGNSSGSMTANSMPMTRVGGNPSQMGSLPAGGGTEGATPDFQPGTTVPDFGRYYMAGREPTMQNGPGQNGPGVAAAARSGARPGDPNSPWVFDPVQERWALRPGFGERKLTVRSRIDPDTSLRSGRVRGPGAPSGE